MVPKSSPVNCRERRSAFSMTSKKMGLSENLQYLDVAKHSLRLLGLRVQGMLI